jgi:hypothetical protein
MPKQFKTITKEIFVDHPEIRASVWRHNYQAAPGEPKQYYLRITEKTWLGRDRVVINQFFARSPDRYAAMMTFLNPRYARFEQDAKIKIRLVEMRRQNRAGIFSAIGGLVNLFSKATSYGGARNKPTEIIPWDV